MKRTHDLAQLQWTVSGWSPHFWRFSGSMETGSTALAEIAALPARVPGSVQATLLDAGVIPDWNVGLNARACEWVENRHWIYEATLPSDWVGDGDRARLRCEGLDYSGWILVNGVEIGAFIGSFVPHEFDLTSHLKEGENRLTIAFDCPPRWLGQFGYTSRITEWKPRYNYTWDWTSRLVQIGIWDTIALEVTQGDELREIRMLPEIEMEGRMSRLAVRGIAMGDQANRVRVTLEQDTFVLQTQDIAALDFSAGIHWDYLPVATWQPNGRGEQPLYNVRCQLLDAQGETLDEVTRRVGFKHVEWVECEGAPAGADPWICEINCEPLFLQGANWTPIRPNFADVTDAEYLARLELYRDLGFNLLRVWGGAFLEKPVFHDLCDELGILVWQEFPLSSSGVDNWPPEDEKSIKELSAIASSYIGRCQHHASLLLWCGGNELQGGLDGGKTGVGKPVDITHPLMARLAEVVEREDPGRRFLPTSSSGPRFMADAADFGQGLHWDVHGPWAPAGAVNEGWADYWARDDALFRSETGAPGASGVDLVRAYLGDCQEVPGSMDNPFWRRTSWWIEWPEFVRQHEREPNDLEEYVAWSQQRQQQALGIAVAACKNRFPQCGGIILWMGHDSFPCAANTAIIDFWGRPKPAALAVGEIFRG